MPSAIMGESTVIQTQYCLVSKLFRPPQNRKIFWLREGTNTVGRGNTSEIKLPSPLVSRTHCTITVNGTFVTIEDLSSSNGTYIDKQLLPPKKSFNVVPNDTIGFGLPVDETETDYPVVYVLENTRKRPAENGIDGEVCSKKTALDVIELSSDDSNDVRIVENSSLTPPPGVEVTKEKSDAGKPLSPGQPPVAEDSTVNNASSSKSIPPLLPVLLDSAVCNDKMTTSGVDVTPVPMDVDSSDDDDDILLMSQLFEAKPPPTPKSLSTRSEELPREEESIILDSPEYDDVEMVEDDARENEEENDEPPAGSLTQNLFDLYPTNVNSPKRYSEIVDKKEPTSLSVDSLVEILSSKSQDGRSNSPQPSTSAIIVEPKIPAALATAIENVGKRSKPGPKVTKQISPIAAKPRRSPRANKTIAKPTTKRKSNRPPTQVPVLKKPVVKPVSNAPSSFSVPVTNNAPVTATFKQPAALISNRRDPLRLPTISSSCPLVSEICQWHVMDFLNNKTTGEEKNVSNVVSSVPEKFETVEEYQKVHKSLLSQELWAELIRDAIQQETENREILMYDGIVEGLSDRAKIRMFPPNFNRTTITFQCLMVGEKKSLYAVDPPRLGNVGLIMLKTTNDTTLYPTFAVVTNHPVMVDRPNKSPCYSTLKSHLPSKDGKVRNAGCFLELTFSVKKERLQQCVDKKLPVFFTYRNFKNIQKHWRLLSIVEQINASPLSEIVLDPTKYTPKPVVDKSAKPYSGFCMNPRQLEAVLSITETVWRKEKSVSVIHGPPGTGKTSVICNLVLEILRGRNGPRGVTKKILLCSPSNAAIDELTSKLMSIRGTLPIEDRFKLTRVGMTDQCDDIVKQVTSDTLAVKEVRRFRSSTDAFQSKIESLMAKEKSLRMQSANQLSRSSKAKIANVQSCLRLFQTYKSKGLDESSRDFQKLVSEEEIGIIHGAEIVATTLASSSIKKMLAAFESGSTFCCAIVDESSQAVEPETLQPLYHSVKHLILVGDPLQLPPTTLSSVVRDNNLSLSLFDRLYNAWETNPSAPLYKLVEQYRMHSEIVSFPSRQFYSNRLVTRFHRACSVLKPYTLITHNFREDDDGEMNQDEAKFIIALTKLFLECAELLKYSLGIIVPYRRQCRYIDNEVRRLHNPHQQKPQQKPVFVNTIDSYQGQERDIILFCCVRSERVGFLSDSHRLNVALTRARQCLVIMGNFQALSKDKVWQELYTDALKRSVIVDARKPADAFNHLTRKIHGTARI